MRSNQDSLFECFKRVVEKKIGKYASNIVEIFCIYDQE